MLTVLIVDDHQGFRGRARALLEQAGFSVVGGAASGAEGIAEAGRLRPRLVLLDVQLPDLDGFEVARRLHALDASIDVVLTSTHDCSDYGPLVVECPARGFVAKSELAPAAITTLLA